MFRFVTFVYPETVKLIILAKGNPHFICDARVLVKPQGPRQVQACRDLPFCQGVFR
jgi:hypothetical protein